MKLDVEFFQSTVAVVAVFWWIPATAGLLGWAMINDRFKDKPGNRNQKTK